MKKITLHKPACYSMFLLALFALLALGCKKTKLDNSIPLQNVGNSSASSIRLFNFFGDADVTVNNMPLTAYPSGVNNGNSGGTAVGLSVFPDGVWHSGENASPVTLPNSLLNKDGNIRITISPRVGGGGAPPALTDTTIVNNVGHPLDYYLMPDGHLKVLDRDNMPSGNPHSFKIRVINLPGTADQFNLGLGLYGPVSLTYADGNTVSSQLNNIPAGSTSSYVEVPYGSIQFKLFMAKGGTIDVNRQLAEFPVAPYFDPCDPGFHPQQGLTPRLRTFKPGGVYSIVVTMNAQTLFNDCTRYNATTYINSYRIITELDPGVNNTFARMQAVNALPGKQVTINIDGEPLGGQLPYIGLSDAGKAQQPEYKVYVKGSHHVTAKDQNGQLLTEADITLYPYDNYTVWAYNKADGKPGLLFEANDMTGSTYTSTYHPNGTGAGELPDDGTNGKPRRFKYNYALQTRFLNLCPNLPYITFTNDHQLFLPAIGPVFYKDTIRTFNAYVNLAPGFMPANNPSIIYSLPFASPGDSGFLLVNGNGNPERQYVPNLIRVYRSSPGNLQEVPGTLISEITPVNLQQSFIANGALYTYPQFKLPETGVYTVALVGNMGATSTREKARLIVIKHNK